MHIGYVFSLTAFKMLFLVLGLISFTVRYKTYLSVIYIVFILLLVHWILIVTDVFHPLLEFYLTTFKYWYNLILSMAYKLHILIQNYTFSMCLPHVHVLLFWWFNFFLYGFLLKIRNNFVKYNYIEWCKSTGCENISFQPLCHLNLSPLIQLCSSYYIKVILLE